MSAGLFAGLMSGTSLDGADAVLVDFAGAKPRLLGKSHRSFDPGLKRELLALNASGADEIDRAAQAGNALAKHYAAVVTDLLAAASTKPGSVRALGCHGQTVRHRPERGYTTQLGNAALLAELSGITVVADFRSRDVAAGGQGAPLAPAFHAAVFADATEDRAVLNLGGIANLTILPRQGDVTGFDTGPGNCLLDLWAARHLGKPMDEDGRWASGGPVNPALLERLLQEAYFAASPPKSTGRDLFNERWLESKLAGGDEPQAVQATLLELTACTIANALSKQSRGTRRVIACGGGTKNSALMRQLGALLAPAALETSDGHGVDTQLVEATAFAWLAKQTLDGQPGNLASVTGARGARVLGAIYPA